MTVSILLVEDDDTARMLLSSVLERKGYRVTSARDGETAIHYLSNDTSPEHTYETFDVVITDIRMQGVDGIAVMHTAMEQAIPPAVILMTGYSSVETAVAALRAHAYDYLLKPCDTAELLRCVAGAVQHRMADLKRADAVNLLSRCLDQLQFAKNIESRDPTEDMSYENDIMISREPERFVRVGSLAIDLFRHTVTFDNQLLRVTPIEYALLQCLAQSPGRVIRYQEIVQYTHGSVVNNTDAQALLRAHVHNLRRKMNPNYLVNVRGIGYMLVNPENSSM